MPNITLDVTPAVDRTPTTVGREVAPGHIFSLMAFIKDGTATSGQVHIQAGTYHGSEAEDDQLVVLLNAYVYPGNRPSWTGKVPIEGNEGIWATARSDAASVTIRVIGKALKHDP